MARKVVQTYSSTTHEFSRRRGQWIAFSPPAPYNETMQYENMIKANFIERQNRFVASVSLQRLDRAPGGPVPENIARVHVKNTGRCRELLVPGASVWLQDHSGDMGQRKLRYSLINVEKKLPDGSSVLINMDSQAPNQVVCEALSEGRLQLPGTEGTLRLLQREKTCGDSRLDVYAEFDPADAGPGRVTAGKRQKAFIEVKGVTLEEDGIARFPDAPTERGIKHIHELERLAADDFLSYIIFVIQMKGVYRFEPNDSTHAAFGDALRSAADRGVRVLAYDCNVTSDSLRLDAPVPVKL